MKIVQKLTHPIKNFLKSYSIFSALVLTIHMSAKRTNGFLRHVGYPYLIFHFSNENYNINSEKWRIFCARPFSQRVDVKSKCQDHSRWCGIGIHRFGSKIRKLWFFLGSDLSKFQATVIRYSDRFSNNDYHHDDQRES